MKRNWSWRRGTRLFFGLGWARDDAPVMDLARSFLAAGRRTPTKAVYGYRTVLGVVTYRTTTITYMSSLSQTSRNRRRFWPTTSGNRPGVPKARPHDSGEKPRSGSSSQVGRRRRPCICITDNSTTTANIPGITERSPTENRNVFRK
jgi:hypothetical protein